MDDRLQKRVQNFVEQLLNEEKSSLRKAWTLLEIEDLAWEVGDALARELASGDLAERSEESAEKAEHACPDCGWVCGGGGPGAFDSHGASGRD